jgi:hypothetical protein
MTFFLSRASPFFTRSTRSGVDGGNQGGTGRGEADSLIEEDIIRSKTNAGSRLTVNGKDGWFPPDWRSAPWALNQWTLPG